VLFLIVTFCLSSAIPGTKHFAKHFGCCVVLCCVVLCCVVLCCVVLCCVVLCCVWICMYVLVMCCVCIST